MLAFYLRPYIGQVGSLATAAFLEISPGMVYISRYFIHEIFFVFLALGFVLAVLMFIDREKAGPGGGRVDGADLVRLFLAAGDVSASAGCGR